MQSLTMLSLFVAGTVASAAPYAARGGTGNDAANLTSAKISLAQAVAAAEQQVNGKAARAEFESSRAGGFYEVEVVSGQKVFDIRVDAEKGAVISSTEDRVDRDDEHDEED